MKEYIHTISNLIDFLNEHSTELYEDETKRCYLSDAIELKKFLENLLDTNEEEEEDFKFVCICCGQPTDETYTSSHLCWSCQQKIKNVSKVDE